MTTPHPVFCPSLTVTYGPVAPRDWWPDDGPVVGSLCTGYGGLDLGVLAALGGGRVAWVADPDRHVRTVLDARLPGVPNLGDIRTVDWSAVPPVDVITAGFPCQDISSAGHGAGIQKGNRSGLWHEVIAAVRRIRPALLVVENVAAIRWRERGFGIVLGDLAEAGYDATWASVRASDVGAPHQRERVFVLAWPEGDRRESDTASLSSPVWSATDAAGDRRRTFGNESEAAAGRRPSGGPLRRGDRARATCRVDFSYGGFRGAPADTDRKQLQRRGGPAELVGALGTSPREGRLLRPVARDRDRAPRDPATTEPRPVTVEWGIYAEAIRGWEARLGRPAPHPTEPWAKGGRPRLSPLFVEWLMGLDPGWVTDSGLSRNAQLHALGNGVVPQQAARAVALLLAGKVEQSANPVGEQQREAA